MTSSSSEDTTPTSIGTADFTVGKETYQTWYKVFGDLHSGTTPLITLHGGPGFSHHYMVPHKHLWTRAKIPVVLYDQIGNGASTHLPDAPKEFWTPELFMDELENLLDHLGIRANYDLVGHSWGGMLAGQFAATRRPTGLRHLILASGLPSMQLYSSGTNLLLSKFPITYQTALRKHEAEGTFDSKEYQELSMEFMKKHICTVDPWPKELMDSFAEFTKDPTVYHTMLGPSEFCITGTLKDWDITGILHNISCPTLMISAPNDSVQEIVQLPWFLNIPKIKWVELANSSHLGMFEEPERYLHVLQTFLTNRGAVLETRLSVWESLMNRLSQFLWKT